MKINRCDPEKLFLYVEALEGREDALTTEEQAAIVAHVVECDACRTQVEEIQNQYVFLQNLPRPVMPDGLPGRIVEEKAGAKKEAVRWMFRLRALAAGAMVLFVVFLSGLWIGQHVRLSSEAVDPDRTFSALVTAQNELLDQLESILEEKADQSLVSAPEVWRYPIEQVRYTSEMIQKYYRETQGDPVTQRGFCRAIYQNVETLESLCQALKEGEQPSMDRGERVNGDGESF